MLGTACDGGQCNLKGHTAAWISGSQKCISSQRPEPAQRFELVASAHLEEVKADAP